MTAPAISLTSVSVWRSGNPEPVIRNLSVAIEAGQHVALIGNNGAGKTSLLLALVGAVAFEGKIRIGTRLLERDQLAGIRREVGFVFSDPQDQLFLPSVREELAFGPKQRGIGGPELVARVHEALTLVGLLGFEERRPSELSLGEQRRLALATVLVCRPRVVLLDEPTASLDPRARRNMLRTIAALEATVICATHDLDAALDLDARVILLRQGESVADGPAHALLRDESLLDQAELELPLSLTGPRAGWSP
jgi:cobalt/nickel transport system ATP-binding protein